MQKELLNAISPCLKKLRNITMKIVEKTYDCYLKIAHKKYTILLILCILLIFLLFFPYFTEYSKDIKIYHAILDLGVADYGLFAALLVGILSFYATMKTNEKNLKMTKIAIMNEKFVELDIKLDICFMDIKFKENSDDPDEIDNFITILKIWNEYRNVFKIIYPKLDDKIRNFFKYEFKKYPNLPLYKRNSERIILDINAMIMSEIIDSEIDYHIKDISQCYDTTDIENMKNLNEHLKITKKSLLNYINNIPGEKTKEETLKKFYENLNSMQKLTKKIWLEHRNFSDF